MPEITVVRGGAPDRDVDRTSDGRIVMSPHSRGFEGVLWQLGAVFALQRLSESGKADFCRVAGIPPDLGSAEFAARFADIYLTALRMAAHSRELAGLLPAELGRQVLSLAHQQSADSVDLPTARWVLRLVHGAAADGVPSVGTPAPAGRILRLSDGLLTRYAVVETPMGDPIWISIARTGIVVKRSSIGFLGQTLYDGGPDESARKTHQLYESFGDVSLPEPVSDPVLRVWVQAAVCMRDAAHMVRALQ